MENSVKAKQFMWRSEKKNLNSQPPFLTSTKFNDRNSETILMNEKHLNGKQKRWISPFARKPTEPKILVNVPKLITAYFTGTPVPKTPGERIAFSKSSTLIKVTEEGFEPLTTRLWVWILKSRAWRQMFEVILIEWRLFFSLF